MNKVLLILFSVSIFVVACSENTENKAAEISKDEAAMLYKNSSKSNFTLESILGFLDGQSNTSYFAGELALKSFGNEYAGVFCQPNNSFGVVNRLPSFPKDFISSNAVYAVNFDLGFSVLINDETEKIYLFATDSNALSLPTSLLFKSIAEIQLSVADSQRLDFSIEKFSANGLTYQTSNQGETIYNGTIKKYIPDVLDDFLEPVRCECIKKTTTPKPTNCIAGGEGSTQCSAGADSGTSVGRGGENLSANCTTTCSNETYACCTLENNLEYTVK